MRQSVTPDQMAAFFRDLAARAAAETLPHFRQQLNVDNKEADGFDPVTEADRQAETVIRSAIESAFPEDGIVGEEHGSVRLDAPVRWVIDPVDGTRSFICGLPVWGTLVGRTEDGVATAGMLSQPYIGELFIADGQKSFIEGPHGRRDLRVSNCRSVSEAKVFTTAPELWSGIEQEGFERLRHLSRLCRFGADCYAFGLVATGMVDIAIEAGLKSYDIMALIPIVRQAGGVIGRVDGGPAEEAGTVIAAATRELFDEAQSLLTV